MKRIILLISTFLTSILLSNISIASSIVYDQYHCAKTFKSIKFPARSNSVRFSRNCKTIFVLPPKKGMLTFQTLSFKDNIQLCDQIDNELLSINSLMRVALTIQKKIKRLTKELNPNFKKVKKLQKKIIYNRTNISEITRDLEDFDEEKRLFERELDNNDSILLECFAGMHPEEICDLAEKKVKTIKEKINEVHMKISSKKDDVQEFKGILLTLLKELKYEKEHNKTKIDNLLAYQNKFLEMNSGIFNLFKKKSSLVGGRADILINLKWSKLLGQFKEMNPSMINIKWKKLEVSNLKLWSNLTRKNKTLPLPAIIDTFIPGLNTDGGDISFGEKLEISVNLSLPFSCLAAKKEVEASQLLRPSIGYEWDEGERTRYVFSYNRASLLRELKSAIKNNTLSLSSLNKILKEDSNGWLRIYFDESVEEEEKDEMKIYLKKYVLDKLIHIITYQKGLHPFLGKKCSQLYCQSSIWNLDEKKVNDLLLNINKWKHIKNKEIQLRKFERVLF